MNIALVSLNQQWENKKQNILNCENYIIEAIKRNSELIIFPEMTLTGFSMNINKISEKYEDSDTIKIFKSFAIKYNIAIIFGLVIKNDDKGLNTLIFMDNKGSILSRYTKIHPFSFADEDQFFISGNNLQKINYKDLTLGFSICYDLRFPEIYSSLSNKSDIIINIANWPKKRIDHWNVLLKARAIENQIFTIGVNRVGVDGNNLKYEESSQIINANGENLKPKHIYKNLKIYNVDKKYTEDFQKTFNTKKDRKNELYKKVL